MATETYVQLPVDGSGQKIRLTELSEGYDSTGTEILVKQEVVALADADGNLVAIVDGGSVKSSDQTMRDLLRGLLVRLDILNAAVDSNYSPPDDLYEEG